MTADEKAFPHRLAFVVLHPDTPLPDEHEVDEFFCPGFWTGPDFKSFKSNYYFDWPSPGDWYELDLEKLDAASETVAILRLGRVRAGDAWTEFPLFDDDPVAPFLARLRAGVYPPLPGVDADRGWALSKLAVWAYDPRDVDEFLATVERFLVRMGGLLIDPEVLDVAGFRVRFER